ncbi:MAG: hypothetical protein ACYDAC_03780 [Candidatus Dormibacteria bacterium]
MRLLLPACMAVALLAACAPTLGSSSLRPTTAARPSATPSLPPDVHTVGVMATGVGAFDLVAVPVAVLHSQATRDVATGVVVHFTTSRGGRAQFSLDSEPVELFGGQSLIVTANCTDTCQGADGVAATVTVAAWSTPLGTPIGVDPATYTCAGSCTGHGYGDATATIRGTGVAAGTTVDLFAACTAAGGAIVGGGQRAVIWSQTGVDERLDVPVILSAQPASCSIAASPASSTATPVPVGEGSAVASPGEAAGQPAHRPQPTVPPGY